MAFRKYLEHLAQHPDSSQLMNKALQCVQLAGEGQLGKLGRVFNEFPLSVKKPNSDAKSNEDQADASYAINHNIINKWLSKCAAILEYKDENDAPFHQDDDQPGMVTYKPEIEKALKALTAEIITQAYNDLLDKGGNLKPEIIRFFNLQSLVEANKSNTKSMEQIIFQLIYSYCSQIILANFIFELQKEFQDPEEKSLYITQINLLNLAIQNLCCGLDENFKPQWASFFTNQIFGLNFDNSPFSEKSCAEFIKMIPPEHIAEIIQLDLVSMEDLRDVDNLFADLITKRSEFWVSVLQHFQDTNDLEHLQAIWELLPTTTQKRWNDKTGTLGLPLPESELAGMAQIRQEKEASEEKAEANDEDYREIHDYSAIVNWIAARDNQFIIDHLVHALSRNSPSNASAMAGHFFKTAMVYVSSSYAKSKEDCKALAEELQNYKFEINLVKKPPQELFKIIFEKTKYKELLGKMLQEYMPGIVAKAGLHIMDSNKPLASAISNNHWELVISTLLNHKDTTNMELEDINALHANEEKIITEFLNYLNKHYEKPTAKLGILSTVLEGQNALGQVIARSRSWSSTAVSVATSIATLSAPPNPRKLLLEYEKQLGFDIQKAVEEAMESEGEERKHEPPAS